MHDPLRQFLAGFLDWREAHAGFDSAIADLPAKLRILLDQRDGAGDPVGKAHEG